MKSHLLHHLRNNRLLLDPWIFTWQVVQFWKRAVFMLCTDGGWLPGTSGVKLWHSRHKEATVGRTSIFGLLVPWGTWQDWHSPMVSAGWS